jgi:hypothetical protein
MLERSPLEYFYDVPTYPETFETGRMESTEPHLAKESSKVCLCIRPLLSARPRSSPTSQREAAEVVVPALVLLW